MLKDLAKQTHTKVIIVEQNPVENSASNLDYLMTESWPFNILLIAGACNARNLTARGRKRMGFSSG
jgi:hypothetical protein